MNFSFANPWVNPLAVVLATLSVYLAYPRSSNPVRSAIFLSYPLPSSDPLIPNEARSSTSIYYGKGPLDFVFVAFYAIVFSFTREFILQRVLRPMARYNGIHSKGKQYRYMEQMYTAIYFGVFGPYGLYVMYHSPVWYFRTEGMYEGFPHRSHVGTFKAYYLLQASYWAQQAVVLCLRLEKPRKDFKVLVGHHVVTLALIWLSYRFHFTYMGLAVYITHDISDFFLAVSSFLTPLFSFPFPASNMKQNKTSKSLSYVQSPYTAPYFAFFMSTWLYLRHYLNLRILLSILTTFTTIGPYELNWETQQYKCWISQYITFSLLALLQCFNLFWLYFVLRIAVTVLWKGEEGARDVRSDDEDEAEGEVDEIAAVREGAQKENKLKNGPAETVRQRKFDTRAE